MSCVSKLLELWTDGIQGPELVEETTRNIQVIKSNLEVSQDRLKSLADKHATDRTCNAGDWMFLKLPPWKGAVQVKMEDKLNPKYIRPSLTIEGISEILSSLSTFGIG